MLIGIHKGYCPGETINYGTLITPKIYKWIKEKVQYLAKSAPKVQP